jgi:hypothetical protein
MEGEAKGAEAHLNAPYCPFMGSETIPGQFSGSLFSQSVWIAAFSPSESSWSTVPFFATQRRVLDTHSHSSE